MCENLKGIISDDTYLYIDTDASWEKDSQGILRSYWDYLGMKKTPSDDPYCGNEKRITFKDLCNKFSGGRKTKTRKTKTRKTKTRKTKTRKTKTRKI